ncbi:MAG: ABC transporter permease [Actinomycetales bacterium]|nr:ABC transporter permease [Actinomycetales bacterium]
MSSSTVQSTATTTAPGGGGRAGRGGHGTREPLSWLERIRAVVGYFLTVYRRTWRGSIIGRFASPLFFLLAMGLGLGSLVDAKAGGVGGLSYLHFVVPAIVATQSMWVAMGESTYQVMGYFKWNKMYAAMLATPLRVADILTGHLLTVVFHLATATTIFVAVAAEFGGFAGWGALWCIPIGVLTGLAFAVPVFAYTASQQTEDGYNILFRMVVSPLMLFSGTFFPIAQLPVWLQPIAWATPLWHGVELARGAATGVVSSPVAAWVHVAALLAFVGIGWVLALRLFTRRLVA